MRRPDPNFPRGILAVLGGLLVGATVLQGQPRDLAGQAAADSLLSARVEGCTVCARMTQDILPGEFIEDAHEFQCGVCHHPHVSHTAEEWMATCTSSGCHARAWNESVMHRIDPAVFVDCTTCHVPHVWNANAEDCASCHSEMNGPGGDVVTTKVTGASTFSHARHDHLPCALCHDSTQRHAELTMRDFAVCMDCHHGTGEFAPASGALDRAGELGARSVYHTPVNCQTCHASSGVAGPQRVRATFELSVWSERRTRTLPFDHARHEGLRCETCHVTAEGPAQADCGSCHDAHHQVGGPCLDCHEAPPEGVHDRSVHETRNCTDCHAQTGFLSSFEADELSTTRDFCVVCHQDQVDHYPARDCAGCHRLPVYTAGGRKM